MAQPQFAKKNQILIRKTLRKNRAERDWDIVKAESSSRRKSFIECREHPLTPSYRMNMNRETK
jgi:hypothetical protein